MNQTKLIAGAVSVVLTYILLTSTLFTVDQRQKAFVLQFGELQRIYHTPGLKAKIPFIQEVLYYDNRLLDYNLPAIEITAGDKKRIVIDLFTRYVIADPVLFFKRVYDENGARIRLASIVPNKMRSVIAHHPLSTLLSKERGAIMDQIHKQVREEAEIYGIAVQDVRIIRTDLPKANSEAIFRRMQSERQREAKFFRSEGEKFANEIRSTADRKRAEILAVARKDGQLIRGQGDAEAVRIYATAFSKEPQFFEFWRSMQAYTLALGSDNTTFVLSGDNDFFKHFVMANGK